MTLQSPDRNIHLNWYFRNNLFLILTALGDTDHFVSGNLHTIAGIQNEIINVSGWENIDSK
jgi:hypothetical protein